MVPLVQTTRPHDGVGAGALLISGEQWVSGSGLDRPGDAVVWPRLPDLARGGVMGRLAGITGGRGLSLSVLLGMALGLVATPSGGTTGRAAAMTGQEGGSRPPFRGW